MIIRPCLLPSLAVACRHGPSSAYRIPRCVTSPLAVTGVSRSLSMTRIGRPFRGRSAGAVSLRRRGIVLLLDGQPLPLHAAHPAGGSTSAAASDSLPWCARAARQITGSDRSERAAQRQSGLRSPRPDLAHLAGAHELGLPAQARIRYRYRTLPKLWPALEDHRRDRRPRGDYQDPHPSALTRPRTAQITGAASRSVPSGLIAHSSSPSIGLSP